MTRVAFSGPELASITGLPGLGTIAIMKICVLSSRLRAEPKASVVLPVLGIAE